MDRAEEARLIERARGGDKRAYGALVDAYQPALRAFLRRLTGVPADADDLAQDAFARSWEVLGRFDGRGSFKSFLCGVAFQYWRRDRRARLRSLARDTAYAALADAETTPPARREQALALRRAMDDLSDEQRVALALCLGQEFTHAEAAEAMRIPLGTVKSHIARGRAKLHAALGVVAEADA